MKRNYFLYTQEQERIISKEVSKLRRKKKEKLKELPQTNGDKK